MMPVKDILATRHVEPVPPVLVIDEMTIRCTVDAGPVCGCDEKYNLIKNYKPFLPGGVHPYNRRKIPGSEFLKLYWKQLKIGECGLAFEKPIAMHLDEISDKVVLREEPREEDLMFVRQPKYTEDYLNEKLKQCRREHDDGCRCRAK